jgi:uncharacterized protein
MKTATRRSFSTLLLSAVVISIPISVQAISIRDVPNPRQQGRWVTDRAEILDQPTEDRLNAMISTLERQNGTEIAVVTVPETIPAASPKQFATTLFNYWGIGKKEQNNGVLFLISKNDRRVEIETGYGIQPILPNAKVGEIIKAQVTPRFKQEDYNGGTLAGTSALIAALRGSTAGVANVVMTAPGGLTSSAASGLGKQSWLHHLNAYGFESLVLVLGSIGGSGSLFAIFTYRKLRRQRLFNDVFLKPMKQSRAAGEQYYEENSVCSPYCNQCKAKLEKTDKATLLSLLTPPQLVARTLGSVKFLAWHCPNCQADMHAGIHVRAYVWNLDRFSKCLACQELTMKREVRVLRKATTQGKDSQEVMETCQCCGLQNSYCQELSESPKKNLTRAQKRRLFWARVFVNTSGGSGYGRHSSASSGSYGGGSDFGGGGSGGGGAGGSW